LKKKDVKTVRPERIDIKTTLVIEKRWKVWNCVFLNGIDIPMETINQKLKIGKNMNFVRTRCDTKELIPMAYNRN